MLRDAPLARGREEAQEEGKKSEQIRILQHQLLRKQQWGAHPQVRERGRDRVRGAVGRGLPRQVQRLRRPRQDVRHQGVRLQGCTIT